MSGPFDCVVIGAGHNGLVCAAYLARAGKRVLVVEAADRVGGAAITREFAPGFRVSAGAHVLHMLPKSIASDLSLARHGLKRARRAMPSTALSPDGAHIGLGLRGTGMSGPDEDNFNSDVMRGAIAFDAVLGSNAGPRAPGTVLNLLYRLGLESGAGAMVQPAGGMGAVSEALAEAARKAGATIRTGARVARVQVRDDAAVGVVLVDGEVIAAGTVISNAGPRSTFLHLLGAEHLDTGFVRRITHFRDKGLTAKLHLALSAPPAFRGLDAAALAGRLILAPSLDYIENAYNPTKYGEPSPAPALEITVPTISDRTLAPDGQHVLSAIVQYAPYAPKAGWPALREGFLDRIIDSIEHYAPGLRQSIVATELLTPEDIERDFNMDGGHWHHGELAFDQFFMVRPVPGAAQYQAPVSGLYLCGAGAHPGGGVAGLAGRNAARQVLAKAA